MIWEKKISLVYACRFIGGATTYFFDYIKERNLIVNVEQKEIYD